MKKLDRIIQQQISEEGREQRGRVQTPDSSINTSFGGSDTSGAPSPPSVLWISSNYIVLPIYGLVPNQMYTHILEGKIPPNFNQIIGGNNGGGFSILVGDVGKNTTTDYIWVFKTQIFSRSTRNFQTRVLFSNLLPPKFGTQYIPAATVMVKSTDDLGRSTTKIAGSTTDIRQVADDGMPVNVKLFANTWAEISLFVHTGQYSFNVDAFRDISLNFDSFRLNDTTPPNPPEWSTTPISSDYLDKSAGTAQNTLNIEVPDEPDWAGVGIYRSGQVTLNTNYLSQPFNQILIPTAQGVSPLNREYKWNIHGSTSQSYSLIAEQDYMRNLVPNGCLLYNTASWRAVGNGTVQRIVPVKLEPLIPLLCWKSSATYSGVAKYDLYTECTSFSISTSRDYIATWYTKAGVISHPWQSAFQITYRKNDGSLCASTPYQLISRNYANHARWTMNRVKIHHTTAYGRLNSGALTGASALSHFCLPQDCSKISLRFKMVHNSSPRSIIYLDGVKVEADSAQPYFYHYYDKDGVILHPSSIITSIESTSYGVMRMPFRGRPKDVYFNHTVKPYTEGGVATEVFYRSSAIGPAAKFSQGIEVTSSYINRFRNGNWLSWSNPNLPAAVAVNRPAGARNPVLYQASTSLYGSTTLALWFPDPIIGDPFIYQTMNSYATANAHYSFWMKVERGSIKIGDWNRGNLQYKSSPWNIISANQYGTDWRKYHLFLATASILHVGSYEQGTLAYLDGVQVEFYPPFSHSTYPHPMDTKRIVGGSTTRPTTYVKASANSFNPSNYTMRMWYTPCHNWNFSSTMPRTTLFSFGEDNIQNDFLGNKKVHRLYYVPFVNRTSAGGYFEFFADDGGGAAYSRSGRIPAKRAEFKAGEPVHIVLTYTDRSTRDQGAFTRLYVNGRIATTADGNWDYPTNTPPRADNLIIGALKGLETDTTDGVSTKKVYNDISANYYAPAVGVISEFRLDNYVWAHEQVLSEVGAQIPNYSPNSNLSYIKFSHLGDRIRDISDKSDGIISYVDNNVAANTTYSYALDAFDYNGNRSILSDTASILAGDHVAPGVVTGDGYLLDKSKYIEYYWTTPSDSDFSYNNIYIISGGLKLVGRIYSKINTRVYFRYLVGYGKSQYIYVSSVDKHGNESSTVTIYGQTLPASISNLEGAIMPNVGYGLVNANKTLRRTDSISWAKTYTTTESPLTPNYSDIIVTLDRGTQSPIKAPMKLGSASSLELNTAYFMYAVDSANGRTNALRMAYALTESTATSATAYPLGKFYTGNTTVVGYFSPHQRIASLYNQGTINAPKIQNTTGNTYFDLANGVLKTHEEDSGDYTIIKGGSIQYYKSAWSKIFAYPRVIALVPASKIRVGYTNNFSDWGLGSFYNPPHILFFPERARIYATASGWSTKSQYLDIQYEDLGPSAVTPLVSIMTEQLIEVHKTGGIVQEQMVPDSGPYIYPSRIDTYQTREGYATACAWDTATGSGPSGIGSNNSQNINRVDFNISWYSSALPGRFPIAIRMQFMTMVCSANWSGARNDYQSHGAPNSTIWLNQHAGKSDANHRYTFMTTPNRIQHSFTIIRPFITPSEYKPCLKWVYCSAEVLNFEASPASDITWSDPTYGCTSGARYINDLKCSFTYYTADGEIRTSTGYGIVNALVVDRG